MIILNIPIKALTNNQAWTGRRFKSPAYKQYENDLCRVLPIAKQTINGEVEVYYKFYISNYGNTDTDNMIKQVQDFVVKRGYIEDDRYIIRLIAEKFKCNKGNENIEINIKKYICHSLKDTK